MQTDTDDYQDFCRRHAKEWRIKREFARKQGNFAAYAVAQRECQNYAKFLVNETERKGFLE
nr:MAG TPA: hypothetical protein [Bacteriophage sp.]